MIGELDKGRTARSLAYLLAKFDRVKIFFVSPPELQMKPDILEYLDEHDVRFRAGIRIWTASSPKWTWSTKLAFIPSACVATTAPRFIAIPSTRPWCARMKPDALILHPLPRTAELDRSVDDDPRALYFRQARNGLFVRMAILTMLLEGV